MARPLRIEYAGAVYHVMGRGNHGPTLYLDDRDRKSWLDALGLCEHATVPRRWVSEHLGMRHASRVTQAIRQVRGSRDERVAALKRRLERPAKTV